MSGHLVTLSNTLRSCQTIFHSGCTSACPPAAGEPDRGLQIPANTCWFPPCSMTATQVAVEWSLTAWLCILRRLRAQRGAQTHAPETESRAPRAEPAGPPHCGFDTGVLVVRDVQPHLNIVGHLYQQFLNVAASSHSKVNWRRI